MLIFAVFGISATIIASVAIGDWIHEYWVNRPKKSRKRRKHAAPRQTKHV